MLRILSLALLLFGLAFGVENDATIAKDSANPTTLDSSQVMGANKDRPPYKRYIMESRIEGKLTILKNGS